MNIIICESEPLIALDIETCILDLVADAIVTIVDREVVGKHRPAPDLLVCAIDNTQEAVLLAALGELHRAGTAVVVLTTDAETVDRPWNWPIILKPFLAGQLKAALQLALKQRSGEGRA